MKAKRFKCKCGCGNFVRPNYKRERIQNPKLPLGHMMDGRVIGINGYGYMNNGIFNTLRCGFDWAIRQLK